MVNWTSLTSQFERVTSGIKTVNSWWSFYALLKTLLPTGLAANWFSAAIAFIVGAATLFIEHWMVAVVAAYCAFASTLALLRSGVPQRQQDIPPDLTVATAENTMRFRVIQYSAVLAVVVHKLDAIIQKRPDVPLFSDMLTPSKDELDSWQKVADEYVKEVWKGLRDVNHEYSYARAWSASEARAEASLRCIPKEQRQPEIDPIDLQKYWKSKEMYEDTVCFVGRLRAERSEQYQGTLHQLREMVL